MRIARDVSASWHEGSDGEWAAAEWRAHSEHKILDALLAAPPTTVVNAASGGDAVNDVQVDGCVAHPAGGDAEAKPTGSATRLAPSPPPPPPAARSGRVRHVARRRRARRRRASAPPSSAAARDAPPSRPKYAAFSAPNLRRRRRAHRAPAGSAAAARTLAAAFDASAAEAADGASLSDRRCPRFRGVSRVASAPLHLHRFGARRLRRRGRGGAAASGAARPSTPVVAASRARVAVAEAANGELSLAFAVASEAKLPSRRRCPPRSFSTCLPSRSPPPTSRWRRRRRVLSSCSLRAARRVRRSQPTERG